MFYNLTITALSVAVALGIGLIELLGLLANKLDITSGPLGGLPGSAWTTSATSSSRYS